MIHSNVIDSFISRYQIYSKLVNNPFKKNHHYPCDYNPFLTVTKNDSTLMNIEFVSL